MGDLGQAQQDGLPDALQALPECKLDLMLKRKRENVERGEEKAHSKFLCVPSNAFSDILAPSTLALGCIWRWDLDGDS
jgi:hypothetical protein